jgi:hypothetical protein
MENRGCPLCWIKPECAVIEHLRRDHRRTEVEARKLLERANEGSLGWNAEGRKRRTSLPLGPEKRI